MLPDIITGSVNGLGFLVNTTVIVGRFRALQGLVLVRCSDTETGELPGLQLTRLFRVELSQ